MEVQKAAVGFMGLLGLSSIILSYGFHDTTECRDIYESCGGFYVTLSSGGKITLVAHCVCVLIPQVGCRHSFSTYGAVFENAVLLCLVSTKR